MRESRAVSHAAYAAAEALEVLGDEADPNTLAERIARILKGVPAEAEFAVILAWLGRTRLVHGLDQVQAPPESRDRFRVPDLFVVFEHEGELVPTLIEVKSTRAPVLKWRPDYYEGLMSYADVMGVPLLVAWQSKKWGVWTLFDARHFTQPHMNYRIGFEDALKETLLGVLGGDIVMIFREGVGFHIVLRKEERLDVKKTEEGEDETWVGTIEESYVVDGEGHRVAERFDGLGQLLLVSPIETHTEVTETHVNLRFVVAGDREMTWAHRSLVSLLEGLEQGAGVHWKRKLLENRLPVSFDLIHDAAAEGIDRNIVHMILHVQPQSAPGFLPGGRTTCPTEP